MPGQLEAPGASVRERRQRGAGGGGALCPRAALRDPQPHELGQVPRHCDSFVSSSADEGFGVNLPSLHLQHDIRCSDAGYRRETGSQETWRQSEFTCRL